ncbi:rubrerythrin family protein [bacterium]|jgi:rubrerythrin|nr:rubrerythrin family protein [bacterium]MBT3581784.1 rubrerythrin family protein [bacterium]MBT4552474.1 rubrerythrin family protein [bacterium]MBT5989153.1 rubrerythrin family protein [bacterium]MBT7087861.1 rubrerythrin family protein [bacterium]
MQLKGSETEKNLWAAFAGESQARNKYTYFASVAKKAGYVQIANIFLESAENEKEHAKIEFKHLKGIGNTMENLVAAAEGENYEHTKMYPEFAKAARKEGFIEIAKSFEEIAKVEVEHEKRYRKLIENIKKDKVFKKDTVVEWKCQNCGYVHKSINAPKTCPACNHPQSYYQVKENNY